MKRTITAAIIARFNLDAAEIAYWNGLDADRQEDYYSRGNAEVRNSAWQESYYGKQVRGYRGRGSSLAEAVSLAWSESPARRAEVAAREAARKAERDATLHTCIECGIAKPERVSLVSGSNAICGECGRASESAMIRDMCADIPTE